MAENQAQIIDIAQQRAARAARTAGAARPRCAATTAAGAPCRNYAVDGGLCRVHAVQQDEQPRSVTGAGTAASRADASPSEPSDASGRGASAGDLGDVSAGGVSAGDVSAGDGGDGSASGRLGARARTIGRDAAFDRVDRQLGRRGFAPAVDALDVLEGDGGLEAWIERLRSFASFVGRRVTGDYTIDDFGFDRDLTEEVLMPLLRPLHRRYWRVASHGAEHVPLEGGALLVANHAGTLPFDALITRLDLFDHTGRHARELGADLVFRTPFIGELARKTGVTLASSDDANRLLSGGELVAVWPEGYKGLGKPWRERYRLQRFGRGGFVATALRAEVPIVPTAIVGSEEIYPLLFDLRVVARLLGLPYFPVVAQLLTFPVLGPFALLPLPSKWLVEYGVPIDTGSIAPDGADDPMVVFDLTDQVRDRIQQMLNRNLSGRRSILL